MKKEESFSEAFSRQWNIIYRHSQILLAISIALLIGAGTITIWFLTNTTDIAEGNLALAQAIGSVGVYAVWGFDAEIIAIFLIVYKTTKIAGAKSFYWKSFHILLMILIANMTLLDFANDSIMIFNRNFQLLLPTNPILEMFNRPQIESLTVAVYNGTHLIDTVFVCQNGRQINSYPTHDMIYVGTEWKEPYKDRAHGCS